MIQSLSPAIKKTHGFSSLPYGVSLSAANMLGGVDGDGFSMGPACNAAQNDHLPLSSAWEWEVDNLYHSREPNVGGPSMLEFDFLQLDWEQAQTGELRLGGTEAVAIRSGGSSRGKGDLSQWLARCHGQWLQGWTRLSRASAN